ncbi:MAG: phosphonate C-P lyase system protein PhnG [Pseudomonadota bacterium]
MTPDQTARKAWMGLLAKAPPERLATLWQAFTPQPDHHLLRPAEVGAVMVQGRTGALGAAFNLGEMSVTRCSVRLATGEVGHAYVQGRDKAKALQAALIDALMQTGRAVRVEAEILAPLRDERQVEMAARAAKAASTKVEFFTLSRGDG